MGKSLESTPLPQLFPDLHQRLELLRTRKPIVNQSAIPVGLLTKIVDGSYAEVSEIVPEFLEILLAQDFRVLAIGAPGHGRRF
jgi:hypothetical protein